MNILLTSIGTRGDIEPFIAVGELLSRKGHQVAYAFPAQFSNIVPVSARFYPLSPKVVELIEGPAGRTVMGKASLWAKAKALIYLYTEGQKVNKELVLQQHHAVQTETPDLIIHNVKCSYATLWGLAHQKPTVMLSPVPYFMHYVKGYAHIGFNKHLGEILNQLTYSLSNTGLTKSIYDAQKNLPDQLTFSKSTIRASLLSKKIIYTISPSLFPRPEYWPDHAQVMGYHARESGQTWQPDQRLVDFVDQHSKIVLLTFGSMVNTTPGSISRVLYKALDELGLPTIVNTAAGGLVELADFQKKQKFLFVSNLPYDWLLPKTYAVIHHGGSGTTHTGLKNGCATLILPHIIDQFGWNRLVHQLGVGPQGISINKITSSKIKELIRDLYENKEYKRKAIALSKRMQAEQMEIKLVQFIEKAAVTW